MYTSTYTGLELVEREGGEIRGGGGVICIYIYQHDPLKIKSADV